MIGFEGRLQWRRQPSFKLRAKPVQYEKNTDHSELALRPRNAPNSGPHSKLAIRSILVRRTIIGQEFAPGAQCVSGSVGNDPVLLLRPRDKVGKSAIFRGFRSPLPMACRLHQFSPVNDDCGSAGTSKPSLAFDSRDKLRPPQPGSLAQVVAMPVQHGSHILFSDRSETGWQKDENPKRRSSNITGMRQGRACFANGGINLTGARGRRTAGASIFAAKQRDF